MPNENVPGTAEAVSVPSGPTKKVAVNPQFLIPGNSVTIEGVSVVVDADCTVSVPASISDATLKKYPFLSVK